ncbi:MAG: Fe(3+) ABC transporter substrate-binding protein [Exiguobacterium marinum]|uniref:Fe(3+) ABC transporter substrate-binding protein n=1 Tax=Exiguobacterium marinum TaxID=273528 RepID=A0ABY7WYX6_9BACL|nr:MULTISPECIES: Fe(3+) ABC transporter substrate-binding protein [Exiguobacterium]WDH76077.1 Fe(3+) ABC transporter substrate-binding protein [Exiguobacterium marinum]
MNKKYAALGISAALTTSLLAACASTDETTSNEGSDDSNVVNVYSSRHYDVDQQLYKQFEEETGIKVNVVEGKSDELLERLNTEGESTEADLFITADAGNLYQAKEAGHLQAVDSDELESNIPAKYRDTDNEWFGLTKRARVIVYSKDRVKPEELSTYEALTEEQWNGKVLVRPSENMYNISLLASFIEVNGVDEAKEWAKGLVNNMARDPQGNDRDQAKAVVAGEGDVAIMNTYYMGLMLNSEDEEEKKVAEQLGVFFPNQDTTGTHVNISGIAMTKASKNTENAQKLMEFMSEPSAQEKFASVNYEYPVNESVEPNELLQSWGEFKEQDINLSVLGENQQEAIRIFNEVGWK